LKKRITDKLKSISEEPILTSFIVLIILSFVIIGLSLPYYINNFYGFYAQVLAEAHGMIFDIAIIGILIFWLNKNGEKRLRIKTYKDEIDDFRLWESNEAAFRTVGNIKRLNRHKIYEIDLVDCYLAKTNLNYVNLTESNLNNADLNNANLIHCNLEGTRLNQTNFQNCNMNQANLKNAYANGANFTDACLIKADLQNAFLIKANFKRAFLMEANLNGCYLAEADFEGANLYKADLRNAVGLSMGQLSNVKSLYLAKFDDNIMKELKKKMPALIEK
jgi:BTB/POZ domain-containing protein KCTD9